MLGLTFIAVIKQPEPEMGLGDPPHPIATRDKTSSKQTTSTFIIVFYKR